MKQNNEFTKTVRAFYEKHQRPMPWRENTDPYYILVSELMLQQTQVSRVIPKFAAFITVFPTVTALANAQLTEVMQQWEGLGYYRRARFLHESAKMIVSQCNGEVPRSVEELVKLPGVGPNTAGAIAVYAFNIPVVFIETNIRTVYIHHYFKDHQEVDDTQIITKLKRTIDKDNPREWYWALMDYGTFLKATHGNISRKSRHYTKQSAFKGSFRQKRAKVLKLCMKTPLSVEELLDVVAFTSEDVKVILEALMADNLIVYEHGVYRIT